METLRVVTHNVYVGQSPTSVKKNLTKLADITNADVIATQESKRFKDTIIGYERFSAPSKGDDGNCLWLIRKSLDFMEERLVTTGGGSYRGPQGELRDEKVYPSILVKKGEFITRLLNIHFSTATPGADDNRAAEAQAIREWFEEGRSTPSGAFGDWNMHKSRVTTFAKTFDGKAMTMGVDGAVVKNMRIVRKRTFKDKFGSDHHRPMLFVLSV